MPRHGRLMDRTGIETMHGGDGTPDEGQACVAREVEGILREHIYPGLIVLGIPPAAAEIAARLVPRGGAGGHAQRLADDLRGLAERIERGEPFDVAAAIRAAAEEVGRLARATAARVS